MVSYELGNNKINKDSIQKLPLLITEFVWDKS
jgi:hypothetical protein